MDRQRQRIRRSVSNRVARKHAMEVAVPDKKNIVSYHDTNDIYMSKNDKLPEDLSQCSIFCIQNKNGQLVITGQNNNKCTKTYIVTKPLLQNIVKNGNYTIRLLKVSRIQVDSIKAAIGNAEKNKSEKNIKYK
jgi:hypothetical protein